MNRLYLYELLRMQEFLEHNFRRNITADDVVRSVGYSPWHGRRIFCLYLGESVSDRLLRFRLEAGKRELRKGKSVEETAACVGFGSREGFAKAFSAQYGVSPGRYARGEETKERYGAVYEYRMSPDRWYSGKNPTEDGLWEFSYFDPAAGVCRRMDWNGTYFEAPYARKDTEDPAWYCRNRDLGYGMHPGKGCNAVKSFLCPQSGTLEYYISLGRLSGLHDGSNPCTLRLYHNQAPVYPQEGPMVLSDCRPVVLCGALQVSRGDRISLFLDAMGHMGRDGVMLYRQRMAYLNRSE